MIIQKSSFQKTVFPKKITQKNINAGKLNIPGEEVLISGGFMSPSPPLIPDEKIIEPEISEKKEPVKKETSHELIQMNGATYTLSNSGKGTGLALIPDDDATSRENLKYVRSFAGIAAGAGAAIAGVSSIAGGLGSAVSVVTGVFDIKEGVEKILAGWHKKPKDWAEITSGVLQLGAAGCSMAALLGAGVPASVAATVFTIARIIIDRTHKKKKDDN